jgi:hypothetical protein
MKVKFIKRHFSGIKEGRVVSSSPDNCQRWIDQGFAEEIKPEVKEEKPKRKRRTKEQIEADNAK